MNDIRTLKGQILDRAFGYLGKSGYAYGCFAVRKDSEVQILIGFQTMRFAPDNHGNQNKTYKFVQF